MAETLKRSGEAKGKIWDERPCRAARWLIWFASVCDLKTSKLEVFDESRRRTVTGVRGWRGAPSHRSGYHLPACLAFRPETQTPAGCRPEGGWMLPIPLSPASAPLHPPLCARSVHLEAATRTAASFLASIQHS